MKRTFKTLGIFLSAIFLLTGCSSDDHEGTTDASLFQVRNFANSGCKKVGEATTRGGYFADYPEYIEYKSMKDGVLSLSHVNAAFNCEPGELKTQATIEENVIKLLETEEHPGANCICPYDLYCEVGPLNDGNYTIIIYNGSYENGERARFSITYKNNLSGKYDF